MLRNGGREGLSAKPEEIITGGNSGHMALNIAVLAGGGPIGLLGYDAKEGVNRKKHWFGDHPDKTAPTYKDMVLTMRTTTPRLTELGVRVVNCSPGSAIDCFPRSTIEEFLASL